MRDNYVIKEEMKEDLSNSAEQHDTLLNFRIGDGKPKHLRCDKFSTNVNIKAEKLEIEDNEQEDFTKNYHCRGNWLSYEIKRESNEQSPQDFQETNCHFEVTPATSRRGASYVISKSPRNSDNFNSSRKDGGFNSNSKKHEGILSSNRTFTSAICGDGFESKDSLMNHRLVHCDETYFTCKICLKKFTRKFYLVSHLKVHSDDKPYRCEICLMKFKHRSNQIAHTKTHSLERHFNCGVCTKSFKTKRILSLHSIVHSDDRPYQCEICSMKFKNKSNQKSHTRTHFNERNFECDICSKKFKRRSHLKRHTENHSPEENECVNSLNGS